MSDIRTSFRFRTDRKAKIFLDNGEVVHCVVRDLSPGGAGVELGNRVLPQTFMISIEGTGVKHRCRMAWKKGDLMGVEFF